MPYAFSSVIDPELYRIQPTRGKPYRFLYLKPERTSITYRACPKDHAPVSYID